MPHRAVVEIAAILEQHRGERHIVVLHEYPDPDAIAAGYAHRLISAQFDIDVDMVYTGEISHQQNIALVRALGNNLVKYREGLDLGQCQAAVFVDHQGTTIPDIVSRLEAAGVPLLFIIDHHEPQGGLQPEFSDIRKTGSTATIYAQYLEQGLAGLDTAQKEHVVVATALIHGLLTDTAGFVRAGAEDLQAAAYLSRFRDAELLALIMNQSRSKHTMEVIRRALGNRMTIESFSIAGVGYLRAEDRDAIPEAADFLLTEENAHTAIVYGLVRDEDREETLVGSMRTAKFTLDPDQFIKDVFGADGEGRYFGGGKVSAGGFSIPVGFLSGDQGKEFSDLKWQVYDAQIKHRILSKLGIDSDQPPETESK